LRGAKKMSIISCWKINFGQKHFQIDKTHFFLLEDKNTFSVNSLNIIGKSIETQL
jgi:hypothetical protein